jgi:D-alanine--poly(phosphoribitol) ligase subunit 2
MEDKVKEVVLELLEEICGDDIVREDLDINLLEEDLMDSLDYTELLVGIEEKLGVVMAPSELKREEMDTPNKIIEQVLKRVQP